MKRRSLSALLALVLALLLSPGALAAFQGFSDVEATDYYADAVAWTVEQGIVQGTGGGRFSPDNTVTRAEAVTFLWRAQGRPEPASSVSPFTDVTDRDAYYYDAVLWAVEEGLVNGVGGNRFDLYSTLAYDQMMALMCRQAGGDAGGAAWSEKAMAWAADSGLTQGLTLSAKAGCPRRDVAYCLWRQLAGGAGEEEELPAEGELALVGDQALAADIMDALINGYSNIELTDYDLDLNEARELAQALADISGDNPYQVESIAGTMDLSGKALRLTINYIGGTAANGGASRAAMEAADAILAQTVTAGMSDYDIAKALHDYLVLNCVYDYDNYLRHTVPAESYTADGALLEGTAVCAGYARAYQLLMQEAGIPCEYVSGYAGGGHAWNVVEIDGAWYHVDTTWDDPVPDRAGYVRYDYFLKSDDYMRANRHTRWTADRTCTSTKYDDADLPDTDEQQEQEEQQQEQEKFNEILTLCFAAIERFPYQTQAELQAATEDELFAARTAYIDLSGSGIDASLLSQYRGQVSQAITERYPDYMIMSFDRTNMRYELRRADVTEEIQRRQDAEREEQEQQQAQQDAEDATAAVEIQALLEKAIAEMNCESQTITLTGYTDSAIKLACENMRTPGYSFDGYTYSSTWNVTDYNLSAKSGGAVTLTNKKWAAAEEQRYLDQIDAALDNGENRVELQPGSYADGKRGSYYASRAAAAAKASGHVTPGGLVCGVDYEVTASGTNANTGIYSLTIRYLNPTVLTVDEYVARIEDAIRERKTYVVFQYQDGDDSRANIEAAVETFWDEKPTVDGLAYGTNYGLTLGTSYNDKTCNITITYK